MDEGQLGELRQSVIDFVLEELPSQAFDPSSIVVEPPLFRLILEEFDFAPPKREPAGAAFQGAVFGFLRADNPHLQVEIRKVHAGSTRQGGVGDIDAWDGDRLALTAEVKYFRVREADLAGIAGFVNEALRRSAIGLVVAQSFEDLTRSKLQDSGIIPLDIEDLVTIVRMWDPAKQRTAATSMMYYVVHVEKNSTLTERLKAFLEPIESSRAADNEGS